jgi:CHASE3 domain sensor protein/anti-sigma regulatory factor (Ser/Thr protein kinase)
MPDAPAAADDAASPARPVRSVPYRRALRRAVLPPVAALVGLSLLLGWQVASLLAAVWSVDHSDRVIAQADRVLKLFVDMETGQRGYLIGGRRLFLQPYQEAEARVLPALDALEKSVAGDVGQRFRAAQLRDAFGTWRSNAAAEIALRPPEDAPPSPALRARFNEARGKRLMDDLRRRFDEFVGAEERLRADRVGRVDTATRRLLVGGLLVVPLLSAWLFWTTRRQLEFLAREYDATVEAEQEALRETAARQRRFVRDMLTSLTEGRLRLIDSGDDLPPPLTPAAEPVTLARETIRDLRCALRTVAERAGVSPERWRDLETATGEAGMNAVVHGGGGVGQVFSDPRTGTLQVRVTDRGHGISDGALHRATMERGYSSAGTLGHGFWLMLSTTDRVWLLTGPRGTTVVLEQDREEPPPAWMQGFTGDAPAYAGVYATVPPQDEPAPAVQPRQ